MRERIKRLQALLAKVEPVPADWSSGTSGRAGTNGASHHSNIESASCSRWSDVAAAWGEAFEMRRDLYDVLVSMLAVAASTQLAGDNQLYFQIIGDPGSLKTRMCKGLLVSRHCKMVSHIKSFHSGWKKAGDEDKDCSFVARIGGMCLVTPEMDTLMSSMNYDELCSQVRQIFDGETQNTYGNSDEDRQYKGLRSPWIQAGTPALMDKDQSRLGDRFIRIRIEHPTEDVKRSIMLSALRTERRAVVEVSNGTEVSITEPRVRRAYALTGGYVDWLRENVPRLMPSVQMSERMELQCIDLAMLTADLRCRPNMDPKKHEVNHVKELPTRLASQFCRLALCLAVALNKSEVDADAMRVVRKIALDTSHGKSLDLARWMCERQNPRARQRRYQDTGMMLGEVAPHWGTTHERAEQYLQFLRRIGVVSLTEERHTHGSWRLTDRVFDLYTRVTKE